MQKNEMNQASDSRASDLKSHYTLRGRILSIAVIGTIGFTLFLAVMLSESKDNADLLKEIRDVRYPVQENLVAAYNELESIDNSLEHAFIASNAALLDHSLQLAAKFRSHLQKTMLLEETHSEAVNQILERFEQYLDDSHALAKATISKQMEFSETTAIKQWNAHQFNLLIDALGDLKAGQSDAMVKSVDAATERASASLKAGLIAGLITAFLLFIVALITARSIQQRINNMVSSLRQIAVGTGDMGVRMPITGADEMTELAFWFNTFLAKLQRVTDESTAEIKRLAFTDTLTDLPNRRMFLKCLNEEIENVQTKGHGSFAVMFMDLDNFKPVNDQLGHEAGDELLRAVALRLVNTVRQGDTISSDPLAPNNDNDLQQAGTPVVARLAGDEFMLIITDIQSPDQAGKIAERIRLAVMEPYKINDMECSIGLSIGICLYSDESQTADDLITSADIAMYEAKKNGKNNYRFFNPALREETQRQLKLDNAIRLAIPNRELNLLYQPQFSLADHKLVGAEALLRWSHPELGALGPDDFIRRAEASGRICELDDWVLSAVFEQLNNWESLGIKPPSIALNFSAAQAARPDLAKVVARIAGTNKHLLPYLEIEITETSAIDNIAVVENNIAELKAMGIKIAMDDFGVGHSSLTLLTRCKIDKLKIDTAVTREIKTDQKCRDVVESIIELATKLDVRTVAEGIEDEIQSRALAQLRCDFGQGFFFSKPLDKQEFTEFLVQQQTADKAA